MIKIVAAATYFPPLSRALYVPLKLAIKMTGWAWAICSLILGAWSHISKVDLYLSCSSDAWAESVIRLAWLSYITDPCSRFMSGLELFWKIFLNADYAILLEFKLKLKLKWNLFFCKFYEVVVLIKRTRTNCEC